MAKSVERYFRLLQKPRRAVQLSGRAWSPAADVYQTGDGWIVKVELAGVDVDDLEFIIAGRTLVVRGCRRDTFYGEGISYHQLEIMYSRFSKTLQFPCVIDGATFVRDYRDGLLILHLRSTDDCPPGGELEAGGDEFEAEDTDES
jgi:HSP20 family molecular chaperone IbpA